jgi:photosystem II stability/assembly factor-like uncharacterized protein
MLDSTLHLGERWIYSPIGVLTVVRLTPQAVTVEISNGDAVLIDPSLRDFGVLAPGSTSSTQPFTLENLTHQILHVSSVAVGSASPFTITQDDCSTQALAPGGTCQVDVEAHPPPGTPLGSTLRDNLTFTDDWSSLPQESARLSVFTADVSPSGAWFTEHTPGSETGDYSVESLSCVPDPNSPTTGCWAVGLRYNGTHPNFGVVFANHGGFRWTQQKLPSGVGQLSYVSCVSISRCWATGYDRQIPSGPAIVATTDGGTTWVRQHPPSGAGNIGQISCVSASRCWVVGTGGAVIATTNGGATWFVEHVPGGTGSPGVSDVSFVNGAVGKAVGSIFGGCGGNTCAGVIWRTTNGGQTWKIERKGHGYPPGLQTISCVDARHCWAAGNTTNSEAVWATSDGSTWGPEQTPLIQGAFLLDITCTATKPARCWAGGGTHDSKAVLLRTVNGGATWTRQQPPNGNSVAVVQQAQAVGPLLGWAIEPNDQTNDWIIATRTGGLAP